MDDPRLQAGEESFTRLLDIGKQCIDEGKTRWTAALDRQAQMLDEIGKRAVALASGAAPQAAGTEDAAPAGGGAG